MTRRFCGILSVLFIIQLCTTWRSSYGFNDEAHRLLSRRAAQPEVSILDGFLRSVLGFEFPNGIGEALSDGKTVNQHIEDGAIREDWGLRVRSHFHNPQLSWDQAGLRVPVLGQIGQSSIIWGQNPNQFSFDKRSWQDARNYYFQALTATSASERKRLYAETFRTLGHQIHLIQDAAAPSHTRNDGHLSFKSLGGRPDPDEFHYWAESFPGQTKINQSNPTAFNTALLNQSSANPNAPIPIARIIDSTDGDIGTLALTPGISMGLAEYSSANFFSDDTVNSANFLSPRSSQVTVRTEPDLLGRKRPYVYFQSGYGEQDYPLALASAMLRNVIDPFATPTESGLDAKVFQGYGTKLFPRAIGYSARLIDYFFRGNIGIPGYNVNLETSEGGAVTAWFMGLAVQNDSSETMSGSFYVLEFDGQQQTQSAVARWDGITLAPGEAANLCLSSFDDTSQCTSNAAVEYQSRPPLNICAGPQFDPPNHFTVVFQGDFGEEKNGGAVVGRFFETCFGTE